MKQYHCECCYYITTIKANFERHCKSKKHLKKTGQFDQSQYQCIFCNIMFSSQPALSRHINHRCKVRKTQEDEQKNAEDFNEMKKKYEELEIKYETLKNEKITEQTINNQNNNINNTVNFNFNNLVKTDYDYLTDKDYIRCLQQNNHCVKALIEKVHFNPKHEENMNFYISNIKGKYVMIYKNNKWQIAERDAEIDSLYDMNELNLNNWFDENNEKYPEVIKSFKRYLQNKDNDDSLVRNVKEQIRLMLYNKRHLPEAARKKHQELITN